MPENTYSPAQRLGVKSLIAASHENIVEHAGSGFQLPESMARLLDERVKELPKDFTYRRLAASPSEFDLPDGERTDVSFITTDAVDRDGDVVLPQGIDWRSYNGVVPMAHDYKSLPVGVNWWIRPKMTGAGNGLVAKTHYPTKPDDWGNAPWMSSAVLHLMQLPIPVCTGKSIGFLPIEMRNATPEEIERRPDWKNKPIVSRGLGLEYSVAPVPCNAPSEMVAVSKAVKAALESGSIPKEFAELVAKCLDLKTTVDTPEADEAKKAAEEANRKAEVLSLALAAPFVTVNTLKDIHRRRQAELAEWAKSESVRQIQLAIAGAAGLV